MTDVMQELIRQREEIDRKIQELKGCVVVDDLVKLDVIGTKGPQRGCYAVSFKYKHSRWSGNDRMHHDAGKWVPIFQKENREEAIAAIPEAISALQKLYDKLTKAGGFGDGS